MFEGESLAGPSDEEQVTFEKDLGKVLANSPPRLNQHLRYLFKICRTGEVNELSLKYLKAQLCDIEIKVFGMVIETSAISPDSGCIEALKL